MYEKKLISELIKKISQKNELINKLSEIYYDAQGKFEEAEELGEFLATNKEFREWTNNVLDLEDEIEALKVDTKYFPLIGESETSTRELGSSSGYSTRIKSKLNTGKGEVPIDCLIGANKEKAIGRYLEHQLVVLREDMQQRLAKIGSLHLKIELDPRVKIMYGQVIKCFVFGMFDASCILCRSISEFLLKKLIKKAGYGNLIKGKKEDSRKVSLPKIAKQYKLLNKEKVNIYYDIAERANNILHEEDTKIEEKHALTSIELLQSFININKK